VNAEAAAVADGIYSVLSSDFDFDWHQRRILQILQDVAVPFNP
jgi:hypothetical protein